MRINCPYCGNRSASEFSYFGDAKLLARPDAAAAEAQHQFYEYLYLRDNPAGDHAEVWYHSAGCRSWLQVKRNVTSHDFKSVELLNNGKSAPTDEKAGS